MKIIKIVLIGIIIGFGTTFLQAQDYPDPPSPPDPPHIENNSDKDSDYERHFSISITRDDDKNSNSNLSISISNSEDTYKLKATYDKSKDSEVLEILQKELSSKKLTRKGNKYTWSSETKNRELYEVRLKEGKLTMELDKRIASPDMISKFENLGQTVRNTLHSEGEKSYKKAAEKLQREADGMQREAERMQREAERMQREAERAEKRLADQYSTEAKMISSEAERLSKIASTYDLEASHKGAVSSNMRSLLNMRMTYYDETTENGFNWTWPTTQDALLGFLMDTKLIESTADISFIHDQSGIYANGRKLDKWNSNHVSAIVEGIAMNRKLYFSFYKQNDHIVIINDEIAIERFFENLKHEKFIERGESSGTFEINGTSAYKNGKQLNSDQLAKINKIALDNNIIPAPGKIAIWKGENTFQVGYRLGEKSYIGTFMKID